MHNQAASPERISERLFHRISKCGFARRKVYPTVMVVVAFGHGRVRRDVARRALAITQAHDRFLRSGLLCPELILHESLCWKDYNRSGSEVDGRYVD